MLWLFSEMVMGFESAALIHRYTEVGWAFDGTLECGSPASKC